MPSQRRVITQLAEAALRQIVSRIMDYRELMRLDHITTTTEDHRIWQSMRHANAIMDLVSVAESFTSARLLNLDNSLSADVVSTWERRRKAWAKYGKVNLVTYAGWSTLIGFVEVRNAIQHGNGRLTYRQLGIHRDEVLTQVRTAAVHLNGDLLVIVVDDVIRCASICSDFINWLDAEAPVA